MRYNLYRMGKIQISDGESSGENPEAEEFDAQKVGDDSSPPETDASPPQDAGDPFSDDGESIPVTKKAPAAKTVAAKAPISPAMSDRLKPPPTANNQKPKSPDISPVPAATGPMTQTASPAQPSPSPSIEPPEEEQNVFEAASHAAETDPDMDYSQYTPLRKSPKKWKKVLLWVVVCLFALAGVGAAGYMIYKQKNHPKPATHSSSKQTSNSNSNSKSNQSSNQNSNSSQPTSGTKNYTSSNLKLSFSYPEKWTVVDSGGGKLTVTSPSQQLTDANGQQQTGQIIMQIENQSSADMSAFKTGPAVAVLKSQKIDYSNPTGTQRASTYISFAQYNSTTVKGGLDGIYVTGDLGYDYAQPIKESDITKIDPLVRVVFVKCSDDKCSSTTPLTISSTMWNDTSFANPITNMLESLAFQ